MQKCARIWLQMKIDDHGIQSDYEYTSGLQYPERTLHMVLRMRGETERTRRTTPMTT